MPKIIRNEIEYSSTTSTANQISYLNTASGLSANNVQGAIDEVVDEKMDKANPVGTGSFSFNRKSGTTIGYCSFTEGCDTTASGNYSHAEGYQTTAVGQWSHAEGQQTSTTYAAYCSHVEGNNTLASGSYAHAEGFHTTSSEMSAHAEGYQTTASGNSSHAEGFQTSASGHYSHAEGYYTTASNGYAHAEGQSTTASGEESHAEGRNTAASGLRSHSEGYGTIASRKCQHVFGEYNVEDTSGDGSNARGAYVEIVGNGTSSNAKSNARTLDWSGNEVLSGSLTATQINGTLPYDNTTSGLSATNVQDAIDEVVSGKADKSDIAITPITNLNYNQTNVSAFTYGCQKYGRLVVLNIASIRIARAIGAMDEELATGLPMPIDDMNRLTIIDPDTNKSYRVRVTTNGKLVCWYNSSTIPVNAACFGTLIYLSAN